MTTAISTVVFRISIASTTVIPALLDILTHSVAGLTVGEPWHFVEKPSQDEKHMVFSAKVSAENVPVVLPGFEYIRMNPEAIFMPDDLALIDFGVSMVEIEEEIDPLVSYLMFQNNALVCGQIDELREQVEQLTMVMQKIDENVASFKVYQEDERGHLAYVPAMLQDLAVRTGNGDMFQDYASEHALQ